MNSKVVLNENVETYFTEDQSLEEILINLLINSFTANKDLYD